MVCATVLGMVDTQETQSARPVKFTIAFDPDLHRRAKVVAAQRGESLTHIIKSLLEAFVSRQEAK